VKQADIAFHTFKIAPKRFERVFSKDRGESHRYHKDSQSTKYLRILWPVFPISNRKHDESEGDDLNYETEGKRLASDKWEK
jgi:hypothetical protein